MFDLLIARYRPQWLEQWLNLKTADGQLQFLHRRFPKIEWNENDCILAKAHRLREFLQKNKEKDHAS